MTSEDSNKSLIRRHVEQGLGIATITYWAGPMGPG